MITQGVINQNQKIQNLPKTTPNPDPDPTWAQPGPGFLTAAGSPLRQVELEAVIVGSCPPRLHQELRAATLDEFRQPPRVPFLRLRLKVNRPQGEFLLDQDSLKPGTLPDGDSATEAPKE